MSGERTHAVTAADAVIVAARRSPIATRGRALAHLTVDRLAAPVIRAALDDGAAALGASASVADVVLGNCMGPGGNPARVAALAAGLGDAVPGSTVDRQCGSGLAAVLDAATAIRAGDDRARVAGGVESASTAPVRTLHGVAYDRAPFAPEGFPDPDMTRAAEALAVADGISRERQDAYALRSQRRGGAAAAAGRFAAELAPLDASARDGAHSSRETLFARDDALTSADRPLSRFRPLFPGGSVTAGNSCRVSDGAAAVLVVPGSATGGMPGLVLRSHAIVGCDPALPGVGAAPAVLAALGASGRAMGDVAAIELVEAFAAQTLAVLGRVGVADDDGRVCADGGALAFGHPWGASAAVAVVRLFSRLVRGGAPAGTLGLATASVGGGMGVAALFEVVR